MLICSGALGSAGCGPGPETEGEPELIAPGEPSVVLGYHTRAGYQPLSVVAEAPVIWGTQGGTWTMPSVRIRGIASPALVSGRLLLGPGTEPREVLGSSEREHRFERLPDGSLECRAIAVPVQHAPPRQFEAITDIYGETAELSITVSDAEGRSSSSSVLVTLLED
jgi:hypothetical protein